MRFDLVRPCPHCPFRNDIEGYLRPERAVEIATAIAEGAEFACHETTEPDPEGEDMVAVESSRMCAGAMLMMEHQDAPNQIMRVAERIGLYDASKLDRSAPVCRSAFEFVALHSDGDDDDETECCSVCNDGCEAPAGMMIGGVAVPVVAEGEVHECPACGVPVCDSCTASDGVTCFYCGGGDDDDG